MKILLISLLAALALPADVNAEFYSQEEKEKFCNLSYDSLNKNRYFRSLWRKECGQNSEVLNNNYKEPKSKKEKKAETESYWLFLRSTHASDGTALEKIEMKSKEQCEEQGKRWLKDAQGRETALRKYFCFEGK